MSRGGARRQRPGTLALLGMSFLVSACLAAPSSTDPTSSGSCDASTDRSTAIRKLVVSDLGIVGDAPTYIALEHGHFVAQGLEVELQRFRSAVDMIPFLGQGRLDAGTGTLSAGFFNGLSEGLDITVVADSASVAPGTSSHLALVIHPSLSDQVLDYGDLRGLRLAINAPAGGLEVELARAVELGGLTLEDVELVYLPFPEMFGAFSVGVIDGAILPEPFLTFGLEADAFVEFAPVGDFYPGHQISVLLFSAALMDDRPTATRYLCAYLQGVRDFSDALIEHTRPRDRVVEAIMKHTPIEDPALFDVMRYHMVDPDGVPNLESIAADLKYYRQAGYVETATEIDAFVDLEMVHDVATSLD